MTTLAERERQHARECAEMACGSNDPHVQRGFLELEKEWLALAKKVEEKPLRWGMIGYWMRH